MHRHAQHRSRLHHPCPGLVAGRGRARCPYAAGVTYGLFGAILAQPGKRDELVGYLLRAAELLEADPSCVHYLVGTSDHEEAVWISEVWADQVAHDASLQSGEVMALVEAARPLIAGMAEQTQFTIHGGKGLP